MRIPVTLDARMAYHSGIGRYIRALVRHLEPSERVDLRVFSGEGRSLLPPERTLRFDAGIYTLREQLLGSWLCRRRRRSGEVWHFPHYNVPWWPPRRSVVTIHDLIHFELAGEFGSGRVALARRVLERATGRAARVIAVSEATRVALERLLPAAASKTVVIHHGVDDRFRPLPPDRVAAFSAEHELEAALLYVGNDKPHKNIPRMLRAFALVRERHPRAQLVLVGPPAEGAVPPGVRRVGAVDDEQLPLWYNAAAAVVLPSLIEGFGFPALEALACGTPVIGSRIPAIREVVDRAGLLVDPTDVPALATSMRKILEEPELAAELERRGRERASEFSWERAARETAAVYAGVADP